MKNYIYAESHFNFLDKIVKNRREKFFNFIKKHNSVSDQKIHNKRFSNTLQKSITENFSKSMISTFKSDFVISNATIEHVGSCGNQKKIHRKILKFLGHDYYSLEKNLNMLSYNDMSNILKDFKNKIDYKIYRIFTFGFVSNILVICYKKPK